MANRAPSQKFFNNSYKWLCKTQGEICLICGKPPPPGKRLEIDHITYDPKHMWDPENISLMCSTDNLSLRHKTEEEHRFIVKFYRARLERERMKEKVSGKQQPPAPEHPVMTIVDFMHGSVEMQAKSFYEPLFAVFAWELVADYGSYPEDDMLDSFFQKTRCSQVTSKRYLNGYCSALGPLKREKDDEGKTVIKFKYPVR